MLMSKSAYAKHRGVSRQTVYDWIARGKVVMSGSKIDVGATRRKQGQAVSRPVYEDAALKRMVNISPRAGSDPASDARHTPFTLSADEAAAMVLMLDDVYPPAESYSDLQNRVHDASEALGLEIRVIDAEEDDRYIRGLEFYDPEQDCIACRFDSPLFELEALTFFRWLVTEKKSGDLEQATRAGLAALAEPFVYDLAAVYEERAGMEDGEEGEDE